MDAITEELGRSPELFPYGFDLASGSVLFARLHRADFERASFLDARLITPQTVSRLLPWQAVSAAIDAACLIEQCGFIFHIGHVGSTLLSRLIGSHAAVFSLREPVILRTLAQLNGEVPPSWRGSFDGRLAGCLKLLSRTFEPRQLAVVKATSFVSELAATLLSRPSGSKAVMMYVSPESYLATILGGPNSREEARMLAPSRSLRLQRRLKEDAWKLESMSEGEVLALSWTCEMSALVEAHAAGTAGRSLLIDFDRFLSNPAPLLAAVLRHFDAPANPQDVLAIVNGPQMHRYSKAPDHAYDAALRRDVLNQARAVHGTEIMRGLAWLDRAATRFAAVREAINLVRE